MLERDRYIIETSHKIPNPLFVQHITNEREISPMTCSNNRQVQPALRISGVRKDGRDVDKEAAKIFPNAVRRGNLGDNGSYTISYNRRFNSIIQ